MVIGQFKDLVVIVEAKGHESQALEPTVFQRPFSRTLPGA